MRHPDYFLYGKPVMIIHKGYCKWKKTSRYKLLNLIYRILYGKEFIFDIETGKIIEDPYAIEYFKGTNVEIVVLKHYTEDEKENLVDICKGEQE